MTMSEIIKVSLGLIVSILLILGIAYEQEIADYERLIWHFIRYEFRRIAKLRRAKGK